MTYLNGDIFDGNFEAGVKQGEGVLKYPNGDFVTGTWDKD